MIEAEPPVPLPSNNDGRKSFPRDHVFERDSGEVKAPSFTPFAWRPTNG